LSHVRPFVQKRRAFDAQKNSAAHAALDSLTEVAWLSRMNRQRSDRLDPVLSGSPISPDPVPGPPMRNGFTHSSGGNRNVQRQPTYPYGPQNPTRVVPGSSPRSR
jgi:hypothetical protein